jgi:hypothetical protein
VVQERRGEWSEARSAWTAYLTYAKAHEDAGTFVPVAEARIAAIDTRKKLAEEYAAVKERAQKAE